jgi:hypothetical protein
MRVPHDPMSPFGPSWIGGKLPLPSPEGPQRLTSALTSYRSTPTFGRDTIRKFSVNASEMKRKAARDYEDLLQVSYCYSIVPSTDSPLSPMFNSARFRRLSPSSQISITIPSSHCCTYALSGMRLQSYALTTTSPSASWSTQQFASGHRCGYSIAIPARILKPKSWKRKQRLEFAVTLRKHNSRRSQVAPVVGQLPSVCSPLSSTFWVTIATLSGCSERRIHSRLN